MVWAAKCKLGTPILAPGTRYNAMYDQMQCVIQRKTVLHCIEVWAAKRKLGTSILAPGANYSNAELGVMYNVKLHFIVEKAVICNAMLRIM